MHTELGPFGTGVAASCPSDYMAQVAVLGTEVARPGGSDSVNTCYCYCTSAVLGSERLENIGHEGLQCYTVVEQLNAIGSCGLELVQPVQPELLGRLERPAHAAC